MMARFIFPTIVTAMAILSSGCAHMMDPCSDKLLKRIPSPDGTWVLSLYHRECPSLVLTDADIEKPPGFLQRRGEVICYVMSWNGRHPVEAEWKDAHNIFISTSDRLEKFDFHDPKETCVGIKISYGVQFRNEQQTTDSPEVIGKIKKVLSDLGPCITHYYSSNDPVGYIDRAINNGEHRSAVELILDYAYSASCPIAPETYATLKELSETFDLKPGHLKRVEPLVKR
jgi:hypothetical protein